MMIFVDVFVSPWRVKVPVDPVVEEIFAHEANENVQCPFEKTGEGEGVAHAEVLGEGVCDDANWQYKYKIIKNECFQHSNIVLIRGIFPFLNLVFIQEPIFVNDVKHQTTSTVKKSHSEIGEEEEAEAADGLVQVHPPTLNEQCRHDVSLQNQSPEVPH